MEDKSFLKQTTPTLSLNKIISFNYYEKNSLSLPASEKNDFFELIYVDSGSLECTIDGNFYTVNPDTIVLIFPGQTHRKKRIDPLTSFLTVSFSSDSEERLRPLKNKLLFSDLFIKNIYLQLLFERICSDEYGTDVILGCLYQILSQLLRQNIRGKIINPVLFNISSQNTTSNKTVNFMIDFINRNIDKNVSLSDMSESLKLNPSHISRLFKKYTGVSMTRYILVKKLSLSKLLLLSNNFTVTKISDMLGFSSVHYFSNCFKKEFGISPGIYAHTKDNIS